MHKRRYKGFDYEARKHPDLPVRPEPATKAARPTAARRLRPPPFLKRKEGD